MTTQAAPINYVVRTTDVDQALLEGEVGKKVAEDYFALLSPFQVKVGSIEVVVDAPDGEEFLCFTVSFRFAHLGNLKFRGLYYNGSDRMEVIVEGVRLDRSASLAKGKTLHTQLLLALMEATEVALDKHIGTLMGATEFDFDPKKFDEFEPEQCEECLSLFEIMSGGQELIKKSKAFP